MAWISIIKYGHNSYSTSWYHCIKQVFCPVQMSKDPFIIIGLILIIDWWK